MGLPVKEGGREIIRPICTNMMRKARKIALKVESCVNFTVVLVRDIVTKAESLMLIKGIVGKSGHDKPNDAFV